MKKPNVIPMSSSKGKMSGSGKLIKKDQKQDKPKKED